MQGRIRTALRVSAPAARRRFHPLVRAGAPGAALLLMSIQCTMELPPEPLYGFETCGDLETFLVDRVLHPRVAQGTTVGAQFLLGCAASAEEPMENLDRSGDSGFNVTTESAGAADDSGGGGSTSYTTTNTQEADVDEADFVKNDGEYIYVLRRGHLVIVDAWPPESAHVISDTAVGDHPFTMFIDGSRALIVASTDAPVREGSLSSFGGSGLAMTLWELGPGRTSPVLLREVRVDGDYVSARRVDDKVLLVSRSALAWPELNRSAFSDDENRARIAEAGMASILPQMSDFIVGVSDAPTTRQAVVCGNTYAPDDTNARDVLLVHTFDIQAPDAPIESTAVIASWSEVYSSTNAIYLASVESSDGGPYTPPHAHTRIHKLRAFQGEGAAEYVATGRFPGTVHNQFSMSEQGDFLRVVVTDDQALDGNVRVQATSLLVLEEEGTALNVAGRVDDIGKGEFVQAVRFFGDRGYVVTYPEETFIDDGTGQVGQRPIVDPLFVLDIEDPRAPRLRGELKVPGYSTYLHPYGEDHLISVGVDTDTANNYQGLALSLFDVSDPDAPSLAVRLNFGDERSVSEAVANHHAFTFFAEKNLLALPHARTATVNGGLESSGLEVFHIDPATGIEHLGTVEQMPLLSKSSLSGFGPQDARCGGVRRSVMMADESETYVYAVSSVGITVASVDDVVHALDDVDYGSAESLCDDTGWTAF